MKNMFCRQMGIYPKEIIQKSRSMPNRAVRLFSSLKVKSNAGESERLTLQETQNPQIGVIYDDFAIKSFVMDTSSGKVEVEADMSLTAVHERLSVFAKLVDRASESVLAELPLQSAYNTYLLNYKEEIVLPTEQLTEHATLLVYGMWGTKDVDEVEIALVEDYEDGAPQIEYVHVYPKKEENYVTLPAGKMAANAIWDEAISYNAAESVKDENHIVVALYRKPDDTSDLDYLCLFGQKRGTNLPLLGIPGKGIFYALPGSEFLYEGQYEPVATCSISPIGGTTGGSMVVASTQTYQADAGKIILKTNATSLEYDLTGPWGVAYQELGNWNVKYFDYHFQISYTIQVGGGTPRRRTEYICSDRKTALEKVKPIALKYGCFKKGSRIVMADGREQSIETIQIADVVLTETGEFVRVQNVWRGIDRIINITLENGRQLGVTLEHPLKTPKGWQRAKDLRVGDQLICWGTKVGCCIQSIEDGGEDAIYNIETEADSGCALIANGIIAGDFIRQNSF